MAMLFIVCSHCYSLPGNLIVVAFEVRKRYTESENTGISITNTLRNKTLVRNVSFCYTMIEDRST